MEIYARQGDLVIEKLAAKLNDEDLIKRSNIVFAGNSSGHRHTLVGDVLAMPNSTQGVTRFRVPSAPLALTHEKPDGHKTVDLAPGDYEIRPLRERGSGADRAVED